MTDRRRALITGITGQDGSYLADFLLARDYDVVGMVHSDDKNAAPPSVEVIKGDLRDTESLAAAVRETRPHELYNLAALTFVGDSFLKPELTCDVNAMGVLRLLEAVRTVDTTIRLFHASTVEIFAGATESPQNETTPLTPRSPYGVAKAFAHQMVQSYRINHHLYVCSGILFNHESPRRPTQFVSRKITRGVAEIAAGISSSLTLGNLDVSRDWGFAGDYVKAMHAMLQQPEAKDYVIATGETHTLREFLEAAFGHVGLRWEDYVRQDPALFRPTEPVQHRGDPARALADLGWKAETSFTELVAMMVEADVAALRETPAATAESL